MHYYLSLGSNLGEREKTIHEALSHIEQQIGPVLRCSSFCYSEPWGFESTHPFCNLCCCVETDKTPQEVLSHTQDIERVLGRTKKSKIINHHSPITNYTDRCIDIDIIRVFDGEEELSISTPNLTIPHRFWQERAFVKVPLEEIMQK